MNNQETDKGIEIANIENVMNEVQKHGYIIIEGKPASGKSAFGISLAKVMAFDNSQPVVFYSLELEASAIARRLLSLTTSLHLDKIKSGDLTESESDNLSHAIEQLIKCPLYINDSRIDSVSSLRLAVENDIREKGMKTIIIDYLQLLKDGDAVYTSRTEELSAISEALGMLSKELDVTVIALSQKYKDDSMNVVSESADKVFRISE